MKKNKKKISAFEEAFGRIKIENLTNPESWKLFLVKERSLIQLKKEIYLICQFTPYEMIFMYENQILEPFLDLENFKKIKKELVFIHKGILDLFERKVDYNKYFYTVTDFRTKVWFEKNKYIEQKVYSQHEKKSNDLKLLLYEYLVTRNIFPIEDFLIDYNINQPSKMSWDVFGIKVIRMNLQ